MQSSWRSLDIRVQIPYSRDYTFLDKVLHAASNASSLETLIIRGYNPWSLTDEMGDTGRVFELPQIRVLQIHLPSTITKIRAPRIQQLGIAAPSLTQDSQHLEKHFQHVKQLEIYRHTSSLDKEVLNWLIESVTHISFEAAMLCMIRGLQLPHLHHLTMDNWCQLDVAHSRMEFLDSVGKSVVTLRCSGPIRSIYFCSTALFRLPNVEVIELESDESRFFLDALSQVETHILCPKLRSITIRRVMVTQKSLRAFAKTRCRNVAEDTEGLASCGISLENCRKNKKQCFPDVEDADYDLIMSLSGR